MLRWNKGWSEVEITRTVTSALERRFNTRTAHLQLSSWRQTHDPAEWWRHRRDVSESRWEETARVIAWCEREAVQVWEVATEESRRESSTWRHEMAAGSCVLLTARRARCLVQFLRKGKQKWRFNFRANQSQAADVVLVAFRRQFPWNFPSD